MSAPAEQTTSWNLETDGESDHYVCDCDDNLTLCGLVVEGPVMDVLPDENLCVVCKELTEVECPECGR